MSIGTPFKVEVLSRAKAARRGREAQDEVKRRQLSSDGESSCCTQNGTSIDNDSSSDSDESLCGLDGAEDGHGGHSMDKFMRLAHRIFPLAQRGC